MKIKINFRKIFAYIFTFILLYQPNYPIKIFLFKIDNFVILFIFMIFYLIYYLLKQKKIIEIFKKKFLFTFSTFIVLATAYFSFRTIMAGTSITNLNDLRIIQNLMPIVYLVACLILNNELNEMGYTKKDKYKFIINIALIQSAIAIAMFLIPSLKEIAFKIFYQNSENINIYISKNRLHGICNGDYTYSLQILHGILALFTIIYAYTYNEKRYCLYSLIILAVTLLNGRSGIIIFAVGLLFFIIKSFFKLSNFKKTFEFLIIILFSLFILYKIVVNFMPNTVKLMNQAISDVLSFKDGNENTETGTLNNMMKFPQGFSFIIGKGFRVYGLNSTKYGETFFSDVGFVNDIYMGGIIFCFFLYGAYFMLYKLIKSEGNPSEFEKTFSIVLLISLFLANIKGEVFRSVLLQMFLILSIVFMSIDKPLNEYTNK